MSWIEWAKDEWKSTENPYSYAKVWRTGLQGLEIKRRGILPYIFSARVGRNGQENKKYFKNYSEARSYAIQWVKRN